MSSAGILHLRFAENVVSNAMIEKSRSYQIDLAPAQKFRKLIFHANQCQTGNMVRFKLDQNVHVAVRPEIAAEN